MQRRSFIHIGAASLLLPVAAKPGFAALAEVSSHWDYAFFDARFENAHRIAERWPALAQSIAVHGDITPVWRNGLDRMTGAHALRLRGVTTQSFLFCLRILAAEQAHIDEEVSRLDRDLFLWTIHSIPRSQSMKARHG